MVVQRTFKMFAAAMMLCLLAMPAFGQDQPGGAGGNRPPGQGGNGGNGGGNRPSFADYRQRMLDGLKQQLGTSDEEFKAMLPKIEQIYELRRQAMSSGRSFGGFGGRGGRGNPDPNAPSNPTADRAKELQALLENKDAKIDDIKAKLAALREARAKAKEELAKAQQELREVLSQRQEAVAVMNGLLD